MSNDGSRNFRSGSGRVAPTAKDSLAEGGSIFLADYRGPIGDADTVRLHPADRKYREPLVEMLRRHSTAIGYNTTALVTAALEGLRVISYDKNHIINQPNWIELLPYADWHYGEIKSGEAIKHLMDTYELNTN